MSSSRVVALVVACTILVGGAALADDPTYDVEGPAIGDFGDNVGLPEDLARAKEPDSYADAVASASVGATCTQVARNDRSSTGPPADNIQEWQVVLFVPSDKASPPSKWDRGTVCSDGTKVEPAIGWSIHNGRRWMYTSPNIAKSFRPRLRTISAYGRSFQLIDVMYVRGLQTDAYYANNPFETIQNELQVNRRWDRTNTKVIVFADVLSRRKTDGTTLLGQAPYGGRMGFIFRRLQYLQGGAFYYNEQVWGCNDVGDAVPMHEGLHLWTIFSPASPEYDTNASHNTTYHAAQTYDIMYYKLVTSYSGQTDANTATAAGKSQFDPGADSYTLRVKSYPGYLVTGPSTASRNC